MRRMPVKTCMLPGELCFVCHGGRGRGVEVGTKDEVRHPVALSSMLVPSHEAVLSHTMGRQHGKPDQDQTGMDVTAWETPHCGRPSLQAAWWPPLTRGRFHFAKAELKIEGA